MCRSNLFPVRRNMVVGLCLLPLGHNRRRFIWICCNATWTLLEENIQNSFISNLETTVMIILRQKWLIEYFIPVSQSVSLPIWFHLRSKFYSGCGGLLRLGVLVVDRLPLMDAGTHLGCRHTGQMAIHKMQNMMRYSVVIPRAFCGVLVFASRASLGPQPNLLLGVIWGPCLFKGWRSKREFCVCQNLEQQE